MKQIISLSNTRSIKNISSDINSIEFDKRKTISNMKMLR